MDYSKCICECLVKTQVFSGLLKASSDSAVQAAKGSSLGASTDKILDTCLASTLRGGGLG